jgi:hypothetical protein
MKRGSPALGFLRVLASALALMQAAPLALFASPPQQVTQSVTATVTFGPRTTLQVSSQVLHFHVTDPMTPAETSVIFAVGARALKGEDVRLVVEIADPPAAASGASGYALSVVGGSDGVTTGALTHDAPTVVARWAGGGLRTGRVTFRLEGAPGDYEIPLRYLVRLSAGS